MDEYAFVVYVVAHDQEEADSVLGECINYFDGSYEDQAYIAGHEFMTVV